MRPWLLVLLLAVLGMAPALAQGEDAHYARVLRAYRGDLPAAEIQALAETDPGPLLYLGPKVPGEWGIARLFASLPDRVHADLRARGYLKWRAADLPERQRSWLQERVRQLERAGYGPFPLAGKDSALVGFARVELPGLEGPQYSWFITHPGAKQAGWLTLVRAVRTLTPEYEEAHAARLKEVEKLPETARIPSGDWQRVKDPPVPKKEEEAHAEARMDEALYWRVVKAYRGDLKPAERSLLAASDPLIARRLKMTEAADRNLNLLLGKLKDEQHQQLLFTGKLLLRPAELSKEQRRLLEPVIERLNAESRAGGLGDAYDLIPYGRTIIGFSILTIPEAEKPCLTWWIRSPLAPTPSWVTLVNGEAVKAPLYYRTHLEQLRPD